MHSLETEFINQFYLSSLLWLRPSLSPHLFFQPLYLHGHHQPLILWLSTTQAVCVDWGTTWWSKKATECQISLSTGDIFLQFLPTLVTFKKNYCYPDFVSVTYGQGSLAKPFHHYLKLYGHCIILKIFFPDNGKCVLSKNLSLTFCFTSSVLLSFNCL